jgi:hypothetical protein
MEYIWNEYVDYKLKIKLGIYIFVFFTFQAGFIYIEAADNIKEAKKNYTIIHEKFLNWDNALYGIREYHRRKLYNLLIDMIGHEIETGMDYKISIPDVFEKKYYISDLFNARWLHIHGSTDPASIKEITEKGYVYIKEVERNKYLFSLSGRIEKFRIIETSAGRTVHLYLESIKLHSDIK